MRLIVNHVTRYTYDSPVRSLVQAHRLTPSQSASQQIMFWEVETEGAIVGAVFRDGGGDLTQTVSVRGPVSELTVTVKGEVETTDQFGVLRDHRETVRPSSYLRPTRMVRADAALQALSAAALDGMEDETALARAHALSRAVSKAIAYVPGETEPATTAAEALAGGKGVCQDHTHALIAVAHSADFPARYVTGYLHSGSDGSAHEASHAWAELHVSGLGWVGFDAANECCPDERYIRVGSGFDALDAAPIRGVLEGGVEEHMDVTVAVMSQTQQQ
ncbi:transglutaminase family protein [Puniceibacterium sp. IMCC21224]|uniref:transglutaminase family protein n=1 Tax=Puniceibacterium sp. IMCC21224 TaxID=1618204 RepID=UPI00064DA9AB|nr:transglutaminase family protein [Puniceibacterium sp. IMCC21224]KMK68385.1 transglutaminase-like enzyme, predicted cysteine protease [Puniceibacterium sp. IMCC21224]